LGGCPGSTDADILVVVCINLSDNVCFGSVNSLAGLRYRAKAEDIGVVIRTVRYNVGNDRTGKMKYRIIFDST